MNLSQLLAVAWITVVLSPLAARFFPDCYAKSNFIIHPFQRLFPMVMGEKRQEH
jgi:hypothetical protein